MRLLLPIIKPPKNMDAVGLVVCTPHSDATFLRLVGQILIVTCFDAVRCISLDFVFEVTKMYYTKKKTLHPNVPYVCFA
jgi:hypothetical protein